MKLGLSPRSVRRLGEKGILKGKVEITSIGKQWFFSRESVESLVSSYEAKRQKEQRHRTAKDAFAGVSGQPRLRPRSCPNKNQRQKSARWWGHLITQALLNRPTMSETGFFHQKRGTPLLQCQNRTQRKFLGQERERHHRKIMAKMEKLSTYHLRKKLVQLNYARNNKQRHRDYTRWAVGRAERRGSVDEVGKS